MECLGLRRRFYPQYDGKHLTASAIDLHRLGGAIKSGIAVHEAAIQSLRQGVDLCGPSIKIDGVVDVGRLDESRAAGFDGAVELAAQAFPFTHQPRLLALRRQEVAAVNIEQLIRGHRSRCIHGLLERKGIDPAPVGVERRLAFGNDHGLLAAQEPAQPMECNA